MQERSDYFHHALNSIIIAGGSTLLALLIAVPAAWSMAFAPTKRTKDILLWMLSTKMMPPVGVMVPIYLIFSDLRPARYPHRPGLHPLPRQPADRDLDAVHLFQGNPQGHPRSGAHGRRHHRQRAHLCPDADGDARASPRRMLLNLILAWNEAFWTLNLSTSNAAPLTAFIASYSSPEGLFWAKLSAASTLAIAPILVLGWFSQRQLVRGLTFGAVK